MKCCALDLATNTGFAWNDGSGRFECGTWALATPKEITAFRKQRMDRRLDPRVTNLYETIKIIDATHQFDAFVFEDVQFSSYTLQCQLWASLRAALWTAIRKPLPIIECVPVQALKLFAANHGAATKSMMCAALVKQDPKSFLASDNPEFIWTKEHQLLDDNAVDAIWLWKWAQKNLSRIKT